MILFIILGIIIVIIIFILFNLRKLNEKVIFIPPKKTMQNYKDLCNGNCIPYNINDNGEQIYGLLYNKNKIPEWSDNIILYSHGNAGWIGYLIHNNIINTLSNYGSIFLYDYSGYGISTGSPSEKIAYRNIESVWDFLIKEKKVDPNKIIIYGQSLGCAISSHLVCYLKKNNKKLPKLLILEAPFINIAEMANYLGNKISKINGFSNNWISSLSKLIVVSRFDNMCNLKCIDNKLPVYILHSPFDEIIPYEQGKELAEKTGTNFIKINGGHNDGELTQEVLNIL